MKIFVTGASGFIGGHFTEAVSAQHEVFAMARSERSAKAVEGLGAKAVRCELGSVSKSDLQGMDAIVHAAAYVEEWGTREQFFEANVTGTAKLLAAAAEASVPRFILVGTEAAVFAGQPLVDIDETYPYPTRQQYLYSESKAEAEKLVLAASSPALTALSIRPRFVWGPRDNSVLPAILDKARAGAFAWIDGGRARTSTTHVANLVHALTLALHKGRGGEAYFVADDGERTLREFLSALALTEGVDLGKKEVPASVARLAASVVEGSYRLFRVRRTPPLTRFASAMMSSTVTVRTDKARAELGYAPILSVEDGLRAMEHEAVRTRGDR